MKLKWRIVTPEEQAEQARRDAEYWAEEERRWPAHARRNRCMNCGCFIPKKVYRDTRCKGCGESYDSLQ